MKSSLLSKKILLATATCALLLEHAMAATEYPFPLPEKISASLNVNTSQKQPVNRMLLGVNCGWPENLYGSTGFNSPEAKKLIQAFKPPALRFPHGVWANFYDWECDGRRITDGYKGEYAAAVKDHPGLKYGFDGFHKLHDALKFDVLFTWNVNYDSPEKGVRRLQDCRAKGFDVKWVELGNEIFWKTQRSEATGDISKYIQVAKAHTAALKAADPKIKVSVPVHWRNALTDGWNTPLMKEKFYDAISVHKYLRRKNSVKEAGETLSARQEMIETGQLMRKAFPGRAIWLSEWAVSGGDAAITTIGMADTQLGILNHPELFEMADYFQMNAGQSMYIFDKATKKQTRTSIGAAFQILCNVFEGSDRFASTLECTKIGKDIDAISADAVIKDGKLTVFAINKTPRSVPLSLSLDGKPATDPHTHRALLLEHAKIFDLTGEVLEEVPSKDGAIVLPPLSISRIDFTGK